MDDKTKIMIISLVVAFLISIFIVILVLLILFRPRNNKLPFNDKDIVLIQRRNDDKNVGFLTYCIDSLGSVYPIIDSDSDIKYSFYWQVKIQSDKIQLENISLRNLKHHSILVVDSEGNMIINNNYFGNKSSWFILEQNEYNNYNIKSEFNGQYWTLTNMFKCSHFYLNLSSYNSDGFTFRVQLPN